MSGLKLKTEDESGEININVNQLLAARLNQSDGDDWLVGQEPYVMQSGNLTDEQKEQVAKQIDSQIDETIQNVKEHAPGIVGDMLETVTDTIRKGLSNTPDKTAMEDIAFQFSQVYGEYYSDKRNDEELLEYTTQPFWQSMRLSKNRLKEKGLTLEVDIIPESKNSRNPLQKRFGTDKYPMNYTMAMKSDGQNEYGADTKDVLIRRRYVKNGKKVYKKVQSEQHTVTCLKSYVEGDMACCPNCGYSAKIESFIDGCDACGSRFDVKDFEPKISGYSFEQNRYVQFKNLTNSIMVMMAVAFGIVMAVMGLFMLIAPSFKGTEFIGIVGNMVVLGFVSVGMSMFSYVVIVYALVILQAILKVVYKKSIKGEDVANRVMHNLSLNDFFQNMEYKIRNIHLADEEKQTDVFTKCRISDALAQYKDVVDCDMTYLKFLNGNCSGDVYHFDCMARVRMTKYNGKKIRYKYENVTFGVRGKKGVVDKDVHSLHMYICKNCGSTLNLLEGAACKYCGNIYDLENYDWVIDKYETTMKNNMVPIVAKTVVLLIYFVSIFLSGKTMISYMGMNNSIYFNGETIYDANGGEDGTQESFEQGE